MLTYPVPKSSKKFKSVGNQKLSGFCLANEEAFRLSASLLKREKSPVKENDNYEDDPAENQYIVGTESQRKHRKCRSKKFALAPSDLSLFQPLKQKSNVLTGSIFKTIYQLPQLGEVTEVESDFEFDENYQMKGKKMQLSRKRLPVIEHLYRSSNLNMTPSADGSENSSVVSIIEKEAQTDNYPLPEGMLLLKEQIRILHQVISKRNKRIDHINDVVRDLHRDRILLTKRVAAFGNI